MFAKKIKIMLAVRELTVVRLAEKLDTIPSNLYNKFKRDNFSEKEILEICEVLDFTYKPIFIDNKTDQSY